MLIRSSAIELQASHSQLQYQQHQESLRAWKDAPGGRVEIAFEAAGEQLRLGARLENLALTYAPFRLPFAAMGGEASTPGASGLQSRNWSPSKAPDASDRADVSGTVETMDEESPAVEGMDQLQLAAIRMLIKRLTGRDLQLFDAGSLRGGARPDAASPQAIRQWSGAAAAQQASEGWGLTWNAQTTTVEREKTQFAAAGIVRTADGREIGIGIDLQMSREFITRENISLRAGDALKDPLVINFNGSAAQLTQTRFAFDLDADGTLEHIPFVAPGSGFLALDRNGDGRINDGRELFGALSGDGFADLARHDDDGNGWIDEADAIFSRLRVWTRDAEGRDTLGTLQEHDIGAIWLGHVATPFALKDSDNVQQGAVRATGLYLSDSGMPGTLQQIDLVV